MLGDKMYLKKKKTPHWWKALYQSGGLLVSCVSLIWLDNSAFKMSLQTSKT